MSDNKAPDKAVMNRLYKEFGLTPDDIYISKYFKIITRAGFNKIEAASSAKVSFEPLYMTKDVVYLKFIAEKFDKDGKLIKRVETTGEASVDNVKQEPKYLAAMAEKRGRARALLIIEGFYQEGFYSEDEADEFRDKVREGRKRATVKGE